MSSSIWTRCAGGSELRDLAAEPWRVVEAQHQVATRKLVESDAEQAMLEEILERHKPPLVEGGRLHYLLATPFRYPPLRRGSRFGTRHERGIWYGAEALPTAFAEVAYYRLLFLEGTKADLGMVETELSAFMVRIKTRRGIDLTAPPFRRWRSGLASKTSYAATQPLGRAMRDADVEAFRYESARDFERGVNVGVFRAAAFAFRKPVRLETWHCLATREVVEMSKRDYFRRKAHRFPRENFLVRARLPHPAL
ncbi:MAG: RES family NAD+ phosphorylase [Candidatus Binatia bacterium]